MTFGEGVLRLVLGGPSAHAAERDRRPANETAGGDCASAVALDPVAIDPESTGVASPEVPLELPTSIPHEPGFADIEAAVALVSAGLASKVVLSCFPSWPGLLWRAYQLAEETNVLIMPTVVRPGGRVDIVVTRERSHE